MKVPELYGIPPETIAKICKVCVTTARRWKRGTRRMPDAARMIVAGDLGCFDPAWSGWTLRRGCLISPEGWTVSVGDLMTLPLLRAQLNAYQSQERQIQALDEQPLLAELPALFG